MVSENEAQVEHIFQSHEPPSELHDDNTVVPGNLDVGECLSTLQSWVFIPIIGESISKALLIPPNSSLEDIFISEDIGFGFDDLIGVFTKPGDECKSDWLEALTEGAISNAKTAEAWDESFEHVAQRLWDVFGNWITQTVKEGSQYPKAKVTVIPHGVMSFFPFGVAHDAEAETMLLEQFDLHYAPSLFTLLITEAKRKAYQRETESVAFVSWSGIGLQSSPLENSLVTNHFPSDRQIILSGPHLTSEHVLEALPRAGYWHFSAHGSFDLRNPHNSKISLSESHYLPLSELMNVSLEHPLRLVTLSACETGFHDILYAMDEFVGFPGTFLKLGALGVIATLWSVGDEAATLVMARFYDFHIEDNQDPAAALRKAQLWLRDANVAELKEYLQRKSAGNCSAQQAATPLLDSLEGMDLDETPFGFPYFWAAFVLYGT